MNKKGFKYTYSAPTEYERRQIEAIRNQYIPKGNVTDRLSELKSLDNKVKNTPTAVSLIVGISGLLIFGTGLSMILEWMLTLWGVVVSIVGIIPIVFAYPVYNKVYSYMRDKYGEKIVNISDEMLRENNKEDE